MARVLRRLGVFLGWRTEGNGESRTFLEINKWLLLQAGGAWDFPPPPERFSDPLARDLCLRFMRYAMNSVWFSWYRGRPHLRLDQSPPRFPMLWGWKDPRNTITLPLWHAIYPDAAVIYLTRHGVDVAASLKKRHLDRTERLAASFDLRRHAFWLRLRKRRLETYPGDLEEALALWCTYQEIAREGEGLLGKRFLSIRYEDLLISPAAQIERVAAHIGLDEVPENLGDLIGSFQRDRAYAHRRDPELQRFADANAESLARFGYARS